MRLWAWLWTGSGDCPWELTELRLCRDVYHCLPSELADEDWGVLTRHMVCMDVEAKVRDAHKPAPKRG